MPENAFSPAAPHTGASTARRDAAISRRIWTWLGAGLLLLAVGGTGVLLVVRQQVRTQAEAALVAVRDSQERIVRAWIEERMQDALVAAGSPALRGAGARLLVTPAGALPDASDVAVVRTALNGLLSPEQVVTWRLADASGRVVLMPEDDESAQSLLPEVVESAMQTVANGKPRFLPPMLMDGGKVPQMAITVAITPSTGGKPTGVLVVRMNPLGSFSRLFEAGRIGATGESLAFDMQGRLISESRFLDRLKARDPGLANAGTSVFTIELRNASGMPKGTPREAMPFTHTAAAAIAGQAGTEMDGHPSYLGAESIDAWKPLPDLGFAITTRQETAEAYRPLRVLWSVFGLVLVVLVGMLVAAALFARRSAMNRQRMESAQQRADALGQYTLGEKLGEGGMGEVYEAHHALMRRPTAVKLMLDQSVPTDEARFEREVQLSCQLTHPNTVALYDFGRTNEGRLYYAMEYLEGMPLDVLLRKHGPQPAGRAIYLMAQVCGALVEAHGKGLVHRDLKPANLFVAQRGGLYDFAKVLDFGLVKQFDRKGKQDPSITVGHAMSGTPLYMSPEVVAEKGHLDGRADLYAVGCILYELVTGRPPFVADTVFDLLRAHVETSPTPPHQLVPGVPADLEAVILRALAKHPADRQPDAASLRRELLACACASDWSEAHAAAWWQALAGAESERTLVAAT